MIWWYICAFINTVTNIGMSTIVIQIHGAAMYLGLNKITDPGNLIKSDYALLTELIKCNYLDSLLRVNIWSTGDVSFSG